MPGTRRGNRRILDVWLGEQARRVLDQDPQRRTRGEILVSAVEFSANTLADRFGRQSPDRSAMRQGTPTRAATLDRGRHSVFISVSEREAEFISGQVARTSLSLGAYCEQALMLYAETYRA